MLARNRRRPFADVLAQARRRAARLGIPFTLRESDLEMPDVCPALGIPLVSGAGAGGRQGGRDNSPSLDRLRPEAGYTKENVRVISTRANRIKSDATSAELLAVARWMKKHGL
jgi:hypothetical protein